MGDPALGDPAGLPGGDVAAAFAAFEGEDSRASMDAWIETRFLLFGASGHPGHLLDVYPRLVLLRGHAGEDCRTSIIENVALHRAIVAAWTEHAA